MMGMVGMVSGGIVALRKRDRGQKIEMYEISKKKKSCKKLKKKSPFIKGPSTLAFFASVSPSVIAPLPNCFLCIITYVIAREKQRKQLGSGAIADGKWTQKTRV
jgi:hypothetical protein